MRTLGVFNQKIYACYAPKFKLVQSYKNNYLSLSHQMIQREIIVFNVGLVQSIPDKRRLTKPLRF